MLHDLSGLTVTLLVLGAPFALLGLGWLAAKASTALTTSTASKTQLVLARFAHFAELVVRGQQSTVDLLKDAAKDGKLTKEEIQQIASKALEELKRVAGANALSELQQVVKIALPGMDVYLRGLLESELVKSKLPAALVPGSASPR